MNQYHYDQVYSYEKILQEVKDLIMPKIIEMIHPDDLKSTKLSPYQYADALYTHIMALGYNNGDLKAAHDDIFPARNPVLYPDSDEMDAAARMLFNLASITKDFKHQVWAFQGFHNDTKALKPHKEVIVNIKRQLLATQFGG